MSNDTKETKTKMENKELNDLLDSALKDFDNLSIPNAGDDNVTATSTSQEQTNKNETLETDKEWSDEFIKQTLEKMDKKLQNMLQNDDGELNELKSVLQKWEQTTTSKIDGATVEEQTEDDMDFEAAIAQALKTLAAPAEDLQNETEYISAMLKQASLDKSGILPILQGMMEHLLSKDVLYPSMKEISDKYPIWLQQRKMYLTPTELKNYTRQSELLQKVCTELENEKKEDTKATKEQRLECIMKLMQEMEKCGNLPDELASLLLRTDTVNAQNFLEEIGSVRIGDDA